MKLHVVWISHLLAGLETEADVFEGERSIWAVGQVHVAESHLTLAGPIRRRFLLGLTGCLALQLRVFHHPLHRGHLKNTLIITATLCRFWLFDIRKGKMSFTSHHVFHLSTLSHCPLEISHQCDGIGQHQTHLPCLQP